MKLLLIQPSPYGCKGMPIKKKKLYFVGLALPLLAALTPKEWEVEICIETLEDVPFDTDADLIALSSMGHGVLRSIDLAQKFKSLGKTVIMGGYMVSLMPEEASLYCDALVVGDAEPVWSKLLDDYKNNCLQPVYHEMLQDLDPPLPRYDLLLSKNIGDFLPVQAGRGCPKSCSFCSVHCLYRNRYFRRPVQSVIRDIKAVKDLGFTKFLLLDDNILANTSYLFELCSEIKKLDMVWYSQCSIEIARHKKLLAAVADSGCRVLSFGLESISRKSLAAMGKEWSNPVEYPQLIRTIQDSGIDVSTEMVVGADGDTLSSIAHTAAFIRDNKIVVPRFYILTPIPGTDFYNQLLHESRICNDDIYSYNGAEAVHIPKNMTPQELTDAYWQLYRRVFSIPSILARTLFRKEFWKRPKDFLLYLVVNLYYRHHINRKIPPNIY
ncbi:radical SAM protein [Desulfopila sp. IMCC35008]|uniref:B12-binding domain-containing radical SAM protein n=1 Tax=Desulfopila sp. IMCC35008 TaxID=2653858 RepID=UPI0013D79454|nr:radical SAM protein [Desulfopila sp. IMCC35008]